MSLGLFSTSHALLPGDRGSYCPAWEWTRETAYFKTFHFIAVFKYIVYNGFLETAVVVFHDFLVELLTK